MSDRKTYLVQQIVKYANKLDSKGFGANHDGNISAKFDDVLLATPTAVSKGNIVPETIITLDMEGKKIEGVGKTFSEIKLHLAAYAARSDAKAVVHAHPPFTTARGIVGLALKPQLPEAIVSIGDYIPVVDFAMPGLEKNNTLIAQALTKTDILMMQGNGVLAIGDDVEQAYLRIELAEHLAKIEYYANHMGKPERPLQLLEDEINSLLEKRKKAGLGPQARGIQKPLAETSAPASPQDRLKDLIILEIKKVLEET